jgi:NAD(P)-dependent dehydrogenase (short-subunit alcohol dehydrogenase family)
VLDSEDLAWRIFETNFFATLRMSKAFAPILKANGGGAFLNVLSVASLVKRIRPGESDLQSVGAASRHPMEFCGSAAYRAAGLYSRHLPRHLLA